MAYHRCVAFLLAEACQRFVHWLVLHDQDWYLNFNLFMRFYSFFKTVWLANWHVRMTWEEWSIALISTVRLSELLQDSIINLYAVEIPWLKCSCTLYLMLEPFQVILTDNLYSLVHACTHMYTKWCCLLAAISKLWGCSIEVLFPSCKPSNSLDAYNVVGLTC